MAFPYRYTPYLWPLLTSTVFLAVLGAYGARRRTAPGAVSFGILMALAALWVLTNGLMAAGTDDATRIFWFKSRTSLMLPMATAALCFAVEYSGLGKWLTRHTLAVLAIPPIAFVLLIISNEMHHLAWTRIWFDGSVLADRGPAHWVAIGYGLLLSLLHLMVLVWLFVRSPNHRGIVMGFILALLSLRGAAFFNIADRNPVAPLDPIVLVLNFALLPYAFAIIRFRMFDVVPVARDTAIECMADALLVLDVENRIADVNKTAQEILGVSRSEAIGRQVAKVLEAHPDLLDFLRNSGETQHEFSFGEPNSRFYQVSTSPIIDRRGFKLGRLITLHDITAMKRAQAQLLDQERTLAMLKERELLARELHDGIGQTAAAANLQVRCASEFLARGDTVMAESCLKSLAEATQEVKESIRDYLLGVQIGSTARHGFLAGIPQYIDQYSRKYGIHGELVLPPGMEDQRTDPAIEAQLVPIVQEALTNVRKHSGARSVRVMIALSESEVRVAVEDDGQGFDPEALNENEGFGLRSMRGRAESLGGSLTVSSTPNKGTLVSIHVPIRKKEQ